MLRSLIFFASGVLPRKDGLGTAPLLVFFYLCDPPVQHCEESAVCMNTCSTCVSARVCIGVPNIQYQYQYQ